MSKINGIETEWTLIQRQHGNLPTLPEEEDFDKVNYFKSKEEEKFEKLITSNLSELQTIEEEETLEDDDELILQQLKQIRLQQLKQQASSNKYNGVRDISATEYVEEVCKSPPKDTFVVIHLFAYGKEDCKILDDKLKVLADRHKYVKFLRIRGDAAIPNYPDTNCPTILVYRGGEMVVQFVGLGSLGGKELTANDLEWKLSRLGIVKTELKEPPSHRVDDSKKGQFKFVGDFSSNLGEGKTKRRSVFDDDEDDYSDDDL
ncbi:hypothetical protein ABK040_015827 [Willaertia magna]